MGAAAAAVAAAVGARDRGTHGAVYTVEQLHVAQGRYGALLASRSGAEGTV